MSSLERPNGDHRPNQGHEGKEKEVNEGGRNDGCYCCTRYCS